MMGSGHLDIMDLQVHMMHLTVAAVLSYLHLLLALWLINRSLMSCATVRLLLSDTGEASNIDGVKWGYHIEHVSVVEDIGCC